MKKQARVERALRARAAREAAGLSQTAMAQQLGCSRSLVGALEAGANMSVDQLEAYCLVGKCTADSIMFGTAPDLSADDPIGRQFARLDPGLRERLWMLYQVFIRPGARSTTSEPASD